MSLAAGSPVASVRAVSGSQLPMPASRTSTSTIGSNLTSPLTTPTHENFSRSTATGGPKLARKEKDKDVRRIASLNVFPQIPNGPPRWSSMPPVPATGIRPHPHAPRRGSADARSSSGAAARGSSPMASLAASRGKKARAGVAGYTLAASSSTPSLLNGSGEGKSVTAASGLRASDAPSSSRSPPQSRCSSAQGSDDTSATTMEDSGDPPAARANAGGGSEVKSRKERDRTSGSSKGNVIVSVRVRPDPGGAEPKVDGEWMVDGRRSLITYRGREGGNYVYDHVFTPHDQNAKIYDSAAKRLVRRVMEGYHGTVFAYGMTGTGKTFSMQGTATSPGVIPLAITDIFSYIRETPHREFLLRVSYLEIYNEKIHDLLSLPTTPGLGGSSPHEEIKLREDSKRGVYATPLKEEIVQSPTQLLRVIARGDLARRTSSTQYNTRSSRSHAVVQIVVESRERAMLNGTTKERKRSGMAPGGVRVSTLSLIDLAGSERAADNKERRTEGAHINKSLLTLGTVIGRLTGDGDKGATHTADRDGRHLPYRDSKLTRLLQPALSGNSLISILCTIQVGVTGSAAGHHSHTGETLNTLKFAARARNNIVSHAKRAEEAYGGGSGGDAASRVLLERYRVEILDLRRQLDDQAREKRDDSEADKEKEATQRHQEQMLEMQLARTALKERIEHLNRLILCSKSTGVNASASFLPLGSYPGAATARDSRVSSSSARSSSTRSLAVRTASAVSGATIQQAAADAAPHEVSEHASPEEEDDLAGEYGDGIASLAAQVQALHADLLDKNRYIATLEIRLIHARRSSHSRASLGFSPTRTISGVPVEGGGGGDDDTKALMLEKDQEIADLRARLDDKEHMVTALRSAARKRDLADTGPDRLADLRPHSSGSPASSSLHSSNASPVIVVAPDPDPEPDASTFTVPKRVRDDDEMSQMSRMLDEMIQDRADGGPPAAAHAKSPRASLLHLAPPAPQRETAAGLEGIAGRESAVEVV
ncbi:MAG: hypothetical protein M1826_003737 [Phylliscum demangeonii]|nr:MAG: hypothetical protein M1826_003737 [Phylliscum demangeonii]